MGISGAVDLSVDSDWPKATLDLCLPDGRIVSTVEELRTVLEWMGTSLADFKELPAYCLALESGNYPWLADV
jgi:hypothetical protein